MKVIIFDIWGDLGHFRRFFTTSSSLTHSFPIPSTVRGMIAAILGLNKQEYITQTNKFDVAVKILNPINKIRMTLNYIDTKRNSGRTQAFVEFLKNPKFRFYVKLSDESDQEGFSLFNVFYDSLRDKRNIYTVSLGLAQLIANFEFVCLGDAEFVGNSNVVDSVVPVDEVEKILPGNIKVSKERIPFFIKEGREPGYYGDVIAEISGHRLSGSFRNIFRVYYNDKGTALDEFIYFFVAKELVKR